MYVAVKGGERAIENAHRLLAHERRGDCEIPELSLAQISEQLSLSVDRVMSEGSLYDRELAALAVKQPRGDLMGALFFIRPHRTHRLVDSGLADGTTMEEPATADAETATMPRVTALLAGDDLIEPLTPGDDQPAADLTRKPLT